MANKPIILNAEGQSLGRLASSVAVALRGKRVSSFRNHVSIEQRVIVKNFSKIRITKKKLEQKLYIRSSGYPGSVKKEQMKSVYGRNPILVLLRAVTGMLPATKNRSRLLKNLIVEK